MVRCALAILATLALVSCAFAEEQTTRRTKKQMNDLLQRMQRSTDGFRHNVASALLQSGAKRSGCLISRRLDVSNQSSFRSLEPTRLSKGLSEKEQR